MSDVDNAVEIRGLCKSFDGFRLDGVDLDVPRGYVVGLIGENGAGKTTLLKCMTGACIPDSGTVRFPGGMPPGSVGTVFDECHLFGQMDGRQIGRLMASLFDRWDQSSYEELMASSGIGLDKRVRDYSRGMRMRAQVAVAMSHGASLMVMDEATAGMDPAARDEFLDLVMGYMRDEGHSALMSSHVTSDLERIADHIVFLHEGRVALSGPKDDILESYGVAKGSWPQISSLDPDAVVSVRREPLRASALVNDRGGVAEAYPELVVDPASLDDIMVMVIRGDAQ